MNKIIINIFVLTTVVFSACNNAQTNNTSSTDSTAKDSLQLMQAPSAKNFEGNIDGKPTTLYSLKNGNMLVNITNYGARVVSIIVPGKDGKPVDVAVGFNAVAPYTEGGDTYFGAVVGRYGNRIAKGKFKLDGTEYTLATNNAPNHLHGGNKGFSRVVWDGQQTSDSSVELTYVSKDGEEGYPGNLTVKVNYTVGTGNKLKISYAATTDKATVLNLTNHTYFNLNGQGSGDVNDHLVMINANTYTPVDSTLIPTGKFEPVKGTPFDFTTAKTINAAVNDSADMQIKFGKGYDHNFVLNTKGNINAKAAEVTGDQTGIIMDVYTDQPGLQFYGGNFMSGSHTIKGGKKDDYRTAFCMETQHFPDSPNQPNFPSSELKPGEQYKTSTIYAFSIK